MNEPTSYLQVFAALLFVLGLIAGLAWVLKRFAHGNGFMPALTNKTIKRLSIVESLWLDARYRLVIVRDGSEEHKLLLGPQGATPLQAPSLHDKANTSGLNDAQ